MNRTLCVGGVLDGKWTEQTDQMIAARVPEARAILDEPFFGRIHTYSRVELFGDGHGTLRLYIWDKLTMFDALQKLIVGYAMKRVCDGCRCERRETK